MQGLASELGDVAGRLRSPRGGQSKPPEIQVIEIQRTSTHRFVLGALSIKLNRHSSLALLFFGILNRTSFLTESQNMKTLNVKS